MSLSEKKRRDGAGYSVPSAADEIGVSYRLMREAIAEGQIKTIRFGKVERVPSSEVERLKAIFSNDGGRAAYDAQRKQIVAELIAVFQHWLEKS